jgi:glycosyltransferase involved in cell wall biosynthesis
MDRVMTGPPTDPEVSFVVIAYNENANIVNCLSSIADQEGAGSFEVVVVDDGSSDNTATLVTEFAVGRPEFSVLRHPVNLGRGAARQTGLSAARGGLIAMVDADIVLPAHWLHYCTAALASDHVDAVGGVPLPDGDVSFICQKLGLRPRIVLPSVPVPGSNGLYKRRVFELVGVDPSLTEGEDVALNRAMERAGLITRTLSDITVEHREYKGFLGSLKWLYHSGIGSSRQLARYREVRIPDLVFAGQLATIGVAVAAPRRGIGRPIAWAVPFAFLFASSAAHMNRKFEVRGDTGRFAMATLINAVFLGGYFVGRTAGFTVHFRGVSENRQREGHVAAGGTS